jgi:hypothetical protein
MSVWSFRRRKGECTACERAFSDGEPYHSLLLVEGEELARRDLCKSCWKASEGAADGVLFWWRTRHEEGRRKGLALNLEAIEGLFLGLEGRAEQRLRELRYVLCLLLLRKRRLKIERIERSGEGEAMVVRRPRRKEGLRVFVFDFDAERMAQLRDELQRVFDSDEGLMAVAAGQSGPEDGLVEEASDASEPGGEDPAG